MVVFYVDLADQPDAGIFPIEHRNGIEILNGRLHQFEQLRGSIGTDSFDTLRYILIEQGLRRSFCCSRTMTELYICCSESAYNKAYVVMFSNLRSGMWNPGCSFWNTFPPERTITGIWSNPAPANPALICENIVGGATLTAGLGDGDSRIGKIIPARLQGGDDVPQDEGRWIADLIVTIFQTGFGRTFGRGRQIDNMVAGQFARGGMKGEMKSENPGQESFCLDPPG